MCKNNSLRVQKKKKKRQLEYFDQKPARTLLYSSTPIFQNDSMKTFERTWIVIREKHSTPRITQNRILSHSEVTTFRENASVPSKSKYGNCDNYDQWKCFEGKFLSVAASYFLFPVWYLACLFFAWYPLLSRNLQTNGRYTVTRRGLNALRSAAREKNSQSPHCQVLDLNVYKWHNLLPTRLEIFG